MQQDVNTENLKDIVAPEVAAEFMDEKLNQAAELISRQEFTADMQKQEDGSLCKKMARKRNEAHVDDGLDDFPQALSCYLETMQ